MKNNFWPGMWLGGLVMILSSTASAEITCTATPDCATLGYNKTAAQCPSGGVKCPFNSSLMFCLKNTTAYNFQVAVPTALYNVVYHDGSTAVNWSANGKTPIGMIYYLYPKSAGTHGLILSLEQPGASTWQEAIDYCANYSIKGTNVGDWRLPDQIEMMRMADIQTLGGNNGNHPFALNTKLFGIDRADPLSWSAKIHYYNANVFSTDWSTVPRNIAKINSLLIEYHGTYASGNQSPYPGALSLGNYGQSVGTISQPRYWTISENAAAPTNAIYVHLRHPASPSTPYYNYVNAVVKTKYAHFRCIMSF